MNIVILENAAKVEEFTAAIILSEIQNLPFPRIGLATGRTMIGVYKHLVRAHNRGFDFQEIKTFNLDEYVGLSPADEASFHAYMDEHFFSKTNVHPARTHIPHGLPESIEQELEDYRNVLLDNSPLDLQLLGIGDNGHIGFNEPPALFNSDTRIVELSEETRRQNVGAFENLLEDVPTHAITMGIRTILDANKLLLVATGPSKAEAIANAIEGPLQASVPASAIQLHHTVWVVIDIAAANKLKMQSFYHSRATRNSEIQQIHEYIARYM